jgi:ubiquinone/menaquinone biosynthesis C-methylase UbiE
MHQKQAQKVLNELQKTYELIGEEFSQSRHFIGKEFELFEPYLKEKQQIIDVGCGNGRLLYFFEKKLEDFDYLGIDSSYKLLAEAKKIHSKSARADFQLADQLEIPLKSGQFDLAFSIRAFHHLPSKEMRLQALLEMKRILKNDGFLMMTVWNLWQKKYLQHFTKAFFRSMVGFGTGVKDIFVPWGKEKYPRYYHAFTARELKNLFQKAGFDIIQFVTSKDFPGTYDYIIIAQKRQK